MKLGDWRWWPAVGVVVSDGGIRTRSNSKTSRHEHIRHRLGVPMWHLWHLLADYIRIQRWSGIRIVLIMRRVRSGARARMIVVWGSRVRVRLRP